MMPNFCCSERVEADQFVFLRHGRRATERFRYPA